MFKKLNFKSLLVVFGVLLVLVIILQLTKNRGGEGNFKGDFLKADTSEITKITIVPKGGTESVQLIRRGNLWNLASDGKTYQPDMSGVSPILQQLATLKAERVAATDQAEWQKYEVGDSALQVSIQENGKPFADVLIGKFSYQQNPQKFTTYVRLKGEEEVYAVEGFLAMTFNRGLNELRNKTLVDVSAGDINSLTFTYPSDSSFVLKLSGSHWMMNKQPADSAKVAQFVNGISHLSGYSIVSDSVYAGREIYNLRIEGKTFSPIEIKALESDSTVRYIVTSTLNNAHFDGPKSGLISRVFVGSRQFMSSKK